MKPLHRLYFLALVITQPCFSQQISMDAFLDELMSKMTLEEKLGQLNLTSGNIMGAVLGEGGGIEDLIREGKVGATGGFTFESIWNAQSASQESRLKIPLLIGLDVIHGYKTIFPIPLGLAATWDLDRIEQSARIAAEEASASGVCWTYSPMVDIARDPRWGRVAEGAGEDPWLGSQVARALVRGYQGNDLTATNTIMACVKHFALYGAAEAGRDYNTVDMSRLSMYQNYLPPYHAAVEEGVGSVMSSFNLVDGIPATGNRWLLTDLLRDQWGFEGFVVSDYSSVNEMTAHGLGDLQTVSAMALKAGLDMDMQGLAYVETLPQSLAEGIVTMEDIDRACRRVLEAKYKLGLFEDPFRYLDETRIQSQVLTESHLRFSRELAARSMVLLKNKNQRLPLQKTGSIAVVGPLAEKKGDLLGSWVMFSDESRITSVVEGIRNAAGPAVRVTYAQGAHITDDVYLKARIQPFFSFGQQQAEERSPEELLKEAVAIAQDADVVVAVLGESAMMSGEAASRADIGIPESQKNLLKALVETGKPVALVLINGRPLTLEWENEHVDAILEAWAPGTEGGHAIADVLFGAYNPSGKITMTFPRSVGQIPVYYNHQPTGRPFDARNKFTTKYLDIPNEPIFPFGYGLSYTTFEYGEIRLNKTLLKGNESLVASIDVTNTGTRPGEEVVQLYLSDPVASISRAVKELRGFQKIMLEPGASKTVEFTITTDELKFYHSDLSYDWEPGEFIIQIGTNSQDVQMASCIWER